MILRNSLGHFLFSPDTGKDVPGPGKTIPDKAAGEQTGKEKPEDSSPEKGGGQTQTSEGKDQANVSQADYDALLKIHNEMKTKAERRAAEEEAAKQKALEEQGKFKELYEKNNADLEEIKPKLEKYENALKTFLESQIKNLPENLKSIMPDGDPVEQMNWITKAISAGLVEKKSPGDGSPKGGASSDAKDISMIYDKR